MSCHHQSVFSQLKLFLPQVIGQREPWVCLPVAHLTGRHVGVDVKLFVQVVVATSHVAHESDVGTGQKDSQRVWGQVSAGVEANQPHSSDLFLILSAAAAEAGSEKRLEVGLGVHKLSDKLESFRDGLLFFRGFCFRRRTFDSTPLALPVLASWRRRLLVFSVLCSTYQPIPEFLQMQNWQSGQ